MIIESDANGVIGLINDGEYCLNEFSTYLNDIESLSRNGMLFFVIGIVTM